MPAHYMLRRCLSPWRAEQTIAETVAYCRAHDIDEVIWKIDVEHFNHGLTPLDTIRTYLPQLNEARAALAEHGIEASVNPWVTLNHADRCRDMRHVHPTIAWMVAASGAMCKACPCPLSEAWQAWLVEAYALYASTKPHILWLEDDYRTFNHEPVDFGCYCPDHMAALSNAIGAPIDRAELVARLLRPGPPDPIRATWYELLGEAMVDTAARVAQAVHAASPSTRLGLMCSDSLDGRWWPRALQALAGPHEPVARPSFSPYVEVRADGLTPDRRGHQKELACLPPGTRTCPELENYPYTPYAKSARFTRLELGLAQLLGHAAITMNLFDHVGTPLSVDRRYGHMLRRAKPLLHALADRCGPGGTPRGVQVLFDPRTADHKHLRPGDDMARLLHLGDGDGWAVPLQGSGIPVIWDAAAVRCTTGQVLRALDPQLLPAMLAQGLLIDGSALHVLHHLGYGKFTGVEPSDVLESATTPIVAEAYFDRDFDGPPESYMALDTLAAARCVSGIAARDGAQVVSHFMDMDRRTLCPAMVLHENELGGRVATYACDLSGGTDAYFMNWHRRRQLRDVVRWLGRGRADLTVDGDATWMVPVRRDYDGYTLVGIVNLETDDWPGIAVTLASDAGLPARVLMPDDDGRWQDVRPAELTQTDDGLRLVLDKGLAALDFTAIVLEWRS